MELSHPFLLFLEDFGVEGVEGVEVVYMGEWDEEGKNAG